MQVIRRVLGLVVTIGVLSALSIVSAPLAAASTPDTYVVTFKPGTNPDEQAAQFRAQGYDVQYVYRHALSGVAVALPSGALASVRNDSDVKRLEADAPVTISDVRGNATWGLDRTDQRALPLDQSFTYRASAGNGVYAYIIDTGIRASHSELNGRVANGYSAIADGRGSDDCNGHGTHVSGTVAGTTYGMANKATLVPVRVLDCGGSGSWTGVIAGLDYVAGDTTRRPAVVNMSLGGGFVQAVNDAVQGAITSGVTVAVAGGNENTDACTRSPASTPNAITVGATSSNDARASFSNYGTCLDLFAPGVSITSSWNTSDTDTNTISGTSMATPHVAGAAALILGESPALSPAQVTATMLAAATPNVVTSPGTGSPNVLLYADPGPLPPPPPVPANDGFAAATVITPSASGSLSASTLMASKESGEPNHVGNAGGASVWYSFTPSTSGVATFSTQGSSFNTLLAAYTGSAVGSLTPVASNDDDGSGNMWSSVAFAATPGTTYRVAVDGYGGNKGSATLGWTFGNNVTVTTQPLPVGYAGSAYSTQLAAIGGSGSYTWSLGSGTLPAGLNLSSSGVISGTPSSAGQSSFTVVATDGATTGTASLSLVINVPPPANDPFAASELLTLSSSGSLSGSNVKATMETGEPNHAGVVVGSSIWYRFVPAASGTMNLTTVGSSFDTVLAVYTGSALNALSAVASNDDSGGVTSSVTFAVTGGTTYWVAVAGYSSVQGTVALNWTYGNTVIVMTTSLPEAAATLPYSASLSAAGGTGSYTWSIAAGALPAGLSLSSGGTIFGTPTTSGTASFTMAATDGSTTGTKALSITVTAAPPANDPFAAPSPITLSASGSLTGTNASATKEPGEPNHNFNQGGRSVWYRFTPAADTTVTLSTSGSSYDTMLAVYTGSSVSALTVIVSNDDYDGELWSYVTFAATGGRTYQVAIDGWNAQSGSIALAWTSPFLSVTTASLGAGTTGTAYSAQLAATGGATPYSWSLESGSSLPAGLSLSSDGAISGAPSAAGTSTFTVKATDSVGRVGTRSLSIVVVEPVTISTASLGSGTTGAAYSAQLAAAGGDGSYSWSWVTTLPAGLSLSPDGAITGTPTTAGTSSFTVRVASGGLTATKALSIVVAAPVAVSTSSLAGGVVGTAYSAQLAATGGGTPYSWSLESGSSLPAGLSLSSGGAISGAPSAAGTSTFTVKATDSVGRVGTRSLSIVVVEPVTISTASLPVGTTGTGYSAQLSAGGGTGSYSWAVYSGTLPAGLTLSTGGLVTGTPTTTGTASFTVKATSAAATTTKAFSIVVATPVVLSTSTLPGATVNVAYSSQLAAIGGASPYTWMVESGSTLPAGLTLSTGGLLSGTPTVVATSSFVLKVTDSAGRAGTKSLSLAVLPSPGAFGKSSPSNNATKISRTSATFTWAGATGAASYEFCLSTTTTCDGTGSTGWISTGTTRRIVWKGLGSRVTYFWQVRALNSAGNSTLANTGTWWKFQSNT